jgi:hypothetical protein
MSPHHRLFLRAERLEDRDTPAGVYASAVAPGNPPVVSVFDATSRQLKFTVTPFDSSFTGGVNVAVGDVNGDGTPDVVTGAMAGGGPTVSVFSGDDGSLLKTFTVGDDSSRAGVSVAAADFAGLGTADIVAGGVQGGQPVVQVLRFSDGSVVRSFTPFAGATGVSVATGDVNNDGTPDVIAGAGPGGGPEVQVFDGTSGAVIADRMAFEDTFRGGVMVTSGDLNGDGRPDLIVAAGTGGGPRIQAYNGAVGEVMVNFFAYGEAERSGVLAAAFDARGTGSNDVITVDGAGQPANMKAFDGITSAALSAVTFPGLPQLPATGPAPVVTDDSGMTNTRPDPNDPNWKAMADGLKVWDTRTGQGAAVAANADIEVYYTGWLVSNGNVFDSRRSPSDPAAFNLARLIKGWQEGLPGMTPGGIRRLYVPAALGYGASGSPPSIPGNADLIFELKLVSTSPVEAPTA